ncbi:MAG: hypothetical protein IKJ04_07685 [Clostridia bacterium]|nr:hypothetical protein [Clostridia bacterium]MBR4034675.1 hypothetical protein [Clostridia bacterium]
MTQENLTAAVTELDPDILERYFRIKKALAEKKRPKRRVWIKRAAIAACFCLIITLGAIGLFMKNTPDTPQPDFPGYVAAEKYFLEGDVCVGEGATITHKGFDETSITLHIKKTDEAPLNLYFRGLNEGEEEAIFSSVEDLIFTVNGARADSIPTAPGEYEVRIDYSKFIMKCDQMDTFLHIKDYGHFSLNGEGLKIAGIGDIEDISEWETLPFDVPENFSPWFY